MTTKTTASQSTTYHMPLEDVLSLWSGDYDVPMREVRPLMDSENAEFCWHSDNWGSCHEYIHYLAARMRKYGWDGPPVCITGRTLTNGHHRVLAAMDEGLQDIPYTGSWAASGGSTWEL